MHVRLENETSEERARRLQYMLQLQEDCLKQETKEERVARLEHLSQLQKECLQQESEDERVKRFKNLCDNQYSFKIPINIRRVHCSDSV